MRRWAILLAAVAIVLPLLWIATRRSTLATRARASLAQTSGTIAVPGLSAPVEVRRDRWGIPHIYAATEADVFLAQGFVQSQDRLFQMELWRRSSQGRLAELMGPRFVERDRLTRLIGRYRGDATAEWESYGAQAGATARSFVSGVNAWIAHLEGHPPLEFELAGMELEPWSPEDLLSRSEAFTMSYNAQSEVARALVVQAGGTDLAERLSPPDPPTALIVPSGLASTVDRSLEASLALVGAGARFQEAGSNNWAVSGRRSITGHPLVANDPHRGLDHPSLRYLVHLEAPGLHLLGAVVPWFPGVAIGHNDRVGWGLTIFRADVQDLYAEELDPSDPGRYRVGRGWERFREEHETIRVKGGAPVQVVLAFSRHGPIVQADPAHHVAWALRWTGQEPGTAGYLAGLALSGATSAADLRSALGRWRMPAENFVFADTAGEIGYQAAGLVPVRHGNGLLPIPGADGDFEWQRFLSPEELPHSRDPDEGFVATANHNVLPAGYPHDVGHEWAHRDRIDRIEEVLRGKEKFSVEDFQALQHDVKSRVAARLVPLLRTIEPEDPRLKAARDRLLAWDARLTGDSAAAAIFAVWQQRLVAAWVVQEASAHGVAAALAFPSVSLEGALLGLERLGPEGGPLLLSTLADSLNVLEGRLGPDMERWRWGAVHVAWFEHPLGRDEATRVLFNRGPIARDGYANTVNATGGTTFRQTGGATFRAIFDLSDWDRSVATNAPGQSGQPGSPHFDDLVAYWAEGRYFPLAFSRSKVEEVTENRLVLTPGPH